MTTEKHEAGEKPSREAKFWGDFDSLTVGEILTYAAKVDAAERARIIEKESGGKKRNFIIQPLVNWNS